MFVFAVAILVGKNIGSCVGLVAPLAQGETDVTKVFCDILVECLDLGGIGGQSSHQLVCLGADLFVRNDAVAFQARVPLTYLIPTLKGGHLYLRRLRLIVIDRLLLCRFRLFIFLFALEICVLPGIDATVVLFLDNGIHSRRRLKFHFAVARDVYLKLVVQEDQRCRVGEVLFKPEVALRQRRMHPPNNVVLEDISGPEAAHRHVLLPQVRIDWSFASDWCGEILNIAGAAAYDRAIRFSHTQEVNVEILVGGTVGEYQLTKPFEAGFSLDSHPHVEFPLAGAVFFEAVRLQELFDHKRFLRVVGSFFNQSRGFCRDLRRGRRLFPNAALSFSRPDVIGVNQTTSKQQGFEKE